MNVMTGWTRAQQLGRPGEERSGLARKLGTVIEYVPGELVTKRKDAPNHTPVNKPAGTYHIQLFIDPYDKFSLMMN